MISPYIDCGVERLRRVEDKMENEIIEKKIESKLPVFKVFDRYDITEVQVSDAGLKKVINLEPKLIIKSHGRNVVKHGQVKVNIIERLMNRLAVSGHRNKKHKLEKGNVTGKYSKNMGIVLKAFEIIEKKTNKNPIQVLIDAIQNAAPRDEVTVIEYGGARYPQAVDVSPLRRVNLALRNICHAASDKAFSNKKTIVQALAEEILLASDNSGDSSAARRKNEYEKQADSAR
jgi:small subunit ribosomal protein S7